MTNIYQPPDPYNVTAIVSNVATQIAAQYGVDPTRLANIALATMQQESGGYPQAVGDNGTSFGLFQLHEGGELGNLTEQQAFDPTTNAQVAIAVMAQVLKANPNMSDGQVAAAAQRPADPSGYASSVDAILAGGSVPNATGGGQVGSAAAPAGATATPAGGQPLSMSDIPQVVAYIQKNYPADAWLLNIPDVATVLEQAVVNGQSNAQVQAAIEGTNWWKTTSQAVKSYEQNSQANPAEYSFTTPGSQASQTLAQIQSTAAQTGVQLDLQTAQTLATDALKFGWTSQQIQQAIGSRAQIGGNGQTNAGALVAQLKAAAAQYYMTPSVQSLQSWAQNIAAGTQTVQQFQAQMQTNAALKWTGYASQLQQGSNMVQLTDSLRQEAAKTMEVDPNSIDFVNNPVYSKILDYVPPDSPNGVHRVMTNSEMDQYLKSQPQWGYTQGARDQAATLEQALATTWGKIA